MFTIKLNGCALVLFSLALLLPPSQASAYEEFAVNHISTHELMTQLVTQRKPGINTIPICYNYSCKTKKTIQISNKDIQTLQHLFMKNDSAQIERQIIAKSIAFFEILAAKQTPVYNDKGKNYNDSLPGRMDCIDEASNTTHYLQFIENLQLLKWHKVQSPVYRTPWLMGQHWSAHIIDLTSNRHFAVDSWEKDNGLPPLIQAVENWKVRDRVE